MSEPLVSIVTPTYQRATLLERTLRSVAAQGYPSIEHIVVDGGSSDGTVALLKHWERASGIRWVSEPDRGMYDAVNKGLRMASGEVVAYLNSDDCYFPWAVALAVETLRQNPTVDIVYGDVIRQDDRRGITVPVFQPRFSPALVARFGSLLQPAVFMRRNVFERLGGFDDQLRFVADLDFWLRAAQNHRFRRIDDFLAYELFHDETLSQTRRSEMALEDQAMRARHHGLLRGRALPRAIAQLGWQAMMSARWISFTMATHGWGGWQQSRTFLSPVVPISTAIAGIIPSRGSRRRAGVTWRQDPFSVATGIER